MTFTVAKMATSMASYLEPILPGVTFYEDPRQQKTDLPCAFIQLISSDVKLRRTKYLLRSLRFDLTYLDDFNLPDLQVRYQMASEALDLNLETFVYEDTVLRTYNRSSQIDLDGLHYKFELQVWLSPVEDAELMRSMSLILRVRDGS